MFRNAQNTRKDVVDLNVVQIAFHDMNLKLATENIWMRWKQVMWVRQETEDLKVMMALLLLMRKCLNRWFCVNTGSFVPSLQVL